MTTIEAVIGRAMAVAAEIVAARLEAELAEMERVEKQMIADAIKDKAALPPNYWHERVRAAEKARAARRLVEALQ